MAEGTHSDMKYPKIETLFERDEKTHKVTDAARCVEFGLFGEWDVEEKVDGTNVRVIWECDDGGDSLSFRGRTDRAQMPPPLLEYLEKTFQPDHLLAVLPAPAKVTLFGEGYGGEIQKGGNYRPDSSFVLFDVFAQGDDGRGVWLERDAVEDIASGLDIRRAPRLGWMLLGDIVDRVRGGIDSQMVEDGTPGYRAEGVVCRAPLGILDRRGNRVMWKLKTKDFA